MKKTLFIIALSFIAFVSQSQINGKYIAETYTARADTDTIISDVSYPLEIGGENYAWQMSAKWASSSILTTSTIRSQVSADGTTWMNYGLADTLKNSTYSYYTGTDSQFKWIRLFVDVTSHDSIMGLHIWYSFKRKQ